MSRSRYENLSSGTNSQDEYSKYKELRQAERKFNKWGGKKEIRTLLEKEREYFNIIIENTKNE